MSNIKEPYIISVWEEELIPAQDWYVKGEIITEEEYQLLSKEEKKEYRPHSSLDKHYIKEIERLSSEEYNEVLTDEKNKYIIDVNGDYIYGDKILSREEFLEEISKFSEDYERYTVMEHYEEVQGVIIGSDEMDSVFNAINPIFKENVNGSVELTFSIYYRIFDPDTLEFSMNPFVSMLTNEAKIKLKFRNKWYDLVIKSCQEDSTNYMFTYTCKDFYINELSKNGFKVELDAELENNQNTVTKLGKTILKDTDWKINEEKSDLIVESKVEALYVGTLKYDIQIEKVNNYVPDQMVDGSEYPDSYTIRKQQIVENKVNIDGEEKIETSIISVPVLFFYSDIAERKNEPQILAVFKDGQYVNPADEQFYVLDTNEDVITNGCNYRIIGWIDSETGKTGKVEYSSSSLKDNLINIIEIGTLSIYERARAEKVVRSQKTGYDPEMDRFISKYYKLENGKPDEEIEYYGYSKEDILRMNIAENLLANSDDFTSTNTGWIFDGVPEKRTKTKESGYVGQIFQRTAINEANPSSGVLFEESVLELNLKSENDKSRYYKDVQGMYYFIQKQNKDGNIELVPTLVDSETAKIYEETVFDLYKKYQREGVPGYGEKTDSEIETMFKEYLASIRYSKGSRVAINTGVAANRDKIKQLSPGEEYVFAISLGKFKDGETPLELKEENYDEITYGAEVPDAYYEFIEVESDGKLSYDAAYTAIDEYKKLFQANNMQYYQENTTYQGEYQKKYNEVYNQLKEEYKKRYLRTSILSHERTRENWQPGGRRKSGLLGLWGEYMGYYQIFLNVLRGADSEEEICCDTEFLTKLHTALSEVTVEKGSISEQVYYTLIDRDTIKQTDSEGVVHTYYQGLYPEMVMRTMVHSQEKQSKVGFTYRSAYDIMGYDRGLYPEYDDVNKRLVNLTDSFNEFLFSEFYYDILNKWQGENIVNNQSYPTWNYTGSDDDLNNLKSLLQSTYIACYENTNTIFESVEHTKEYHLPSATNAKGGKYYQIHEAIWVQKAKQAAEEHVRELEKTNGLFIPPFEYEEDIIGEGEEFDNRRQNAREAKEYFVHIFSGGYIVKEGDDDEIGTCEKEEVNLADYCYNKEQEWLVTKTDTQQQSSEFQRQLKEARRNWIKEFTDTYNYYLDGESMFGGTWYVANLLGIYYKHWAYGKDIGTYTYNTDTYVLNETTDTNASGKLDFYKPVENKEDSKITWEADVVYTTPENATHYAKLDKWKDVNGKEVLKTEQEKTGGYVFDRETKQVRLFDPYIDVLNATFIPQKDDDGAYVFDPFTWQYRPYRDWDSKEFRDPLTLEIDNNSGVPGDKTFKPIRLFDGHIGSWYDIPTRYNMVRKYEDPEANTDYKYLENDLTIKEKGHYEGKEYEYVITYPKGYQYDIYNEEKRGKYIKADSVTKTRLFDLNNDGEIGIKFSFEGTSFGTLFDNAIENTQDFFNQLGQKFKKIFGIKEEDVESGGKLEELSVAYKEEDDDADKNGAGLANSNIFKNFKDANDQRYDEDRVSIKLYEGKIGFPTLDELANENVFANIINSGKAKITEIFEDDEDIELQAEDEIPLSEQYIKYKPYYWRHWGKQRYDYQPKICIQQIVDGIKVYKPYNNIEDKKPEAYHIYPIDNYSEELDPSRVIFLKDRKTTYRQRIETDYEGFKYKMKKVNKMNKSYWIEAPNGEDYLRHYKFGDGVTKLFDGHLGRWVQCYSADKVESTSDEGLDENHLPIFYIPYDNIMIPYNQRIFSATKQLTRIRKDYDGQNKDKIYVLHNGIYTTLEQYLNEVGYTFPLNYDGLKISFINDYDYDSSYFAIKLPEDKPREKYLEFNLSNDCQYIDLVVKENTLTSEVIKERWAYWITSVEKGFSLTENPLSKLGMLFETSKSATGIGTTKTNDIGRYAFLGMQLFKHIPYTKALKDITTSELIIPCPPKKNEETEEQFLERETSTNEMINILNSVLSEIYGSNSPSIFDFLSKLSENPDSLTILNGSPTLCGQNITVALDTNEEGKNILKVTRVLSEQDIIIPLFPGQAPDAEDLHFTNYYIYDPDAVDHPDTAIFEYVGQDYNQRFVPAYDETCQKIRSIKGKESNYFKLLQDCCSTFDCWMQKDIEHDPTTGQIKYYDTPVYTEIITSEENNNIEPQVFVGEEAKLDGTTRAAKRIHHKLFGKIKKIGVIPEDTSFQERCMYEAIKREDLDEKEQKLLLRLNRINNLSFKIEYMRVPDKQIYFKQFVGEEKWNGFKYGVNLKHIKRTIDSNQFSTRVIVKPNSNEFGKDKFCTIARADENPIKENFIFDFSYYINNHLLDNSDLIGDLYTDVNTRLNYYPRLANLNRERDEIIKKQSSLAVGLDSITAKYETAVQLRDAALEEITKLTQLLTSNYDTYGQIISIPWKYNKSQEYTQRRQNSAPGTTKIITDTYGGVDYTFEVQIPTTTTVVEYPKYNETLRSYLDQMDTYQKEYTNVVKLLEELEPEKQRIEAELAEISAYLEEIANKKNELNKLFYHKYSRYIQEGSWIDENYIDDNLYYLDALSVSRLSAKPKVTYDIGVVDISAAYEYEEDRLLLESELGNRTYIEDTEFFGYRKDDHTKPYWELVVITEKTYNLTDSSQNQVKVRNYTIQFEDIFQTITATSQTLQFNEGSYSRISSLMNENGTLKADAIKESIANSDFIIMNSTNEDVKIDKTGVTITSPNNRANVVKLVSSGILVSSDGGNHYATAITGDGINADLLLAGVINTDQLLIGGRSNPNFMWNKLGISSFKTSDGKIDYSSFVRMDQYGIYGIKNYSKDGREPQSMSINDAFEPLRLKDITENPNAVFGLTWEGFFLNAANGTGKVTIGTGQDFRMSEYSDDQSRWIDRVVIGRLNSEDRYGFQLKNSSDQVVMETDDTGELYLKRKLRISNFGEDNTIEPYGWVYDGEQIDVNVKTILQEKDTDGNLIFEWKDTNSDGIFEQVPKMVFCDIYNSNNTEEDEIIDYRYPLYTLYKTGEKYEGVLKEFEDVIFTKDTVVYEPIDSFTSYFYKYETDIINGQEKDVIKYYTIQDGIHFATRETTIKWQNTIKNQLDRVSLGIVDTYSRKHDFDKVNIDGIYSSSEYLTKVFSVKANAFLPTEQFTQRNITKLIEENENFAIFDNGNLYARNAWIEGNIRATDGTFKGKVYADEGELNDLSVLGAITVKGPYGTIKSETDGDSAWVINSDGTASFRNVKVSGKIETAIFEHEKVQTVAGTLLITSQIPIKDEGIQLVEDYEPYFKASSKEVQNFIVRLTKNQEELYVKQYMLNNPNSSEEDAIINTKEEVNNSVQSILTTKKYKLENDKYVLDSEGDYYLIDDLKMFKVCLEAPAPQIKINIGIHSRYKDFFECKQEDGRLELISEDNDNYSIYENLSDEEKNKVSEELNYLNANNFAKISLLEKFEISQGIEGLKKYEIRGYGSDYIKILSEEDLSSFNLNYVLFLGIFNNLNETQEEVLGISINASGDSTFYPQDSIAIVDINESGQVPKTLLGLFTSNLFGGTSNSLLIDDIVGQYGLYSDNAYVKGTMVSEDLEGGYIAGITTKNKLLVRPNIKGDGVEQVVFFAGQGLNNSVSDGITTNLKFYITREGTLYAKEGLFEGIIKTSKIIGNGTDYGLDIIGDPSATDDGIKAIRFSNSDNENNRINFLQFTTQRSFFYEDSNHGCLFSVLHNGQSNYGVGLFGDPQYDPNNLISYKLSFTQSKKEIQMNYMGKPVAQIRSTGVYIDNINDLGENCECVEAINTNHNVIGINFKLKGIS